MVLRRSTRRSGLTRRAAGVREGLLLLALCLPGLPLAGCGSSHAYRPAASAGNLDESDDSPGAPAMEAVADAPAAAPSVMARSREYSARSERPAKTIVPGRKLAQAGGALGRAPVTASPAEAARGDTARVVDSPVLIYTATLTMAIFEVVPAQAKIEELIQSLGGFLAQKTNNSLTVRIPVAGFREALAGIEKIGDVTRRDISAEDVSQEFFDLEVRIKSARAVRERLEHLLARAVKVEDALGIERELDRVVAELEHLEGRLKFLQGKAQYSTVTVNFAAQPKEVVTKGTFKLPFPWLDDLGLSRLLDLEH
jgi:hypothetical protein